jgi:hypothetical protein
MRALLVLLIRAYQTLRPASMRGACRHVPSCSEYAREAVERHGTLRGGWLVMKRVARCHPLGTHGLDPVP